MPNPTPIYRDAKSLSCADTAKLVRAALKEAFPATKFSVRSSTYSMGASISVTWTDGPTSKMVDTVCSVFSRSDFDGMTDSRTYRTPSKLDEIGWVRFGCDGVSTERRYSPAFLERIVKRACDKHGLEPVPVLDSEYGAHIDTHHPAANQRVEGNGTFWYMQELVWQEGQHIAVMPAPTR